MSSRDTLQLVCRRCEVSDGTARLECVGEEECALTRKLNESICMDELEKSVNVKEVKFLKLVHYI